MNVSPLDLRQQGFRTRLNGFDKVEAAFLVAVSRSAGLQACRDGQT
jgi:hypothetical protein